jgi:hypothetical protein
MTQAEAIRYLITLRVDVRFAIHCTGDIETCPVDECMVCSVRECPYREPLHYHHDGCPACETEAFHKIEVV